MNSIGIVRLDALGDTLLSTPAIRAVCRHWPEARVTVFTSPVADPVLRDWVSTVPIATDLGVRALARRVREHGCQTLLVFTEKRRALLAGYLSRAGVRVGFDPGLTQPLKSLSLRLTLTHRVHYPNDLRLAGTHHEVERYLRLVQALGVPPQEDPGPLHFPVAESALAEGRRWLSEQQLEAPLGLQLTPKWGLDGWPAEALLVRLARRLEGPVVAFFAPSEAEFAQPVLAQCPNLCGYCAPELTTYGGVLSHCRALITVDTGAAHVAAALGIPIVDVFPERHHEHCVPRWRPWQCAHTIVLKSEYRPGAEDALCTRVLEALQMKEGRPG